MHVICIKQAQQAISSTNYITDLTPSLICCALNIVHVLMNLQSDGNCDTVFCFTTLTADVFICLKQITALLIL